MGSRIRKLGSAWLNIARYAEDQAHQVGNNVKFFYPHAHRYREWVIKSYNSDFDTLEKLYNE